VVAPVRLLANCVVGLGFSAHGFELGLEREPHLIGCDAGSADFGPGYLGSGRDPKSRISVMRDLRLMLEGARRLDVPLVFGSCGGAGAQPHVAGYLKMIQELAVESDQHFRVALVHADQPADYLHAAVDAGRIRPLGVFPELSHEDIDSSAAIVAMMGAGPLVAALDAGADVVLAGRCADPAIFACGALRAGVAAGPAWHAAKSIDKGYLATQTPREGSPVLATVDDDGFVIEPMKPGVVCTTRTVAQVTMHENPDPFYVTQPTGAISTQSAHYEQLDGGRVRVTGSEWVAAERPSVKLEGARLVGYRSIMIAGIRDPRLLARLDEFLVDYRRLLERVAASLGIAPERWTLRFRSYGRNGVMGDLEPLIDDMPHEIGLVVDVVADDQDVATALVGRAGPTGSRYDFTGRLGGGGNFAYPFSPNVLSLGPVFEWSAWHVLDLDDENAPFRVELVDV
jgi:hypothetical protein